MLWSTHRLSQLKLAPIFTYVTVEISLKSFPYQPLFISSFLKLTSRKQLFMMLKNHKTRSCWETHALTLETPSIYVVEASPYTILTMEQLMNITHPPNKLLCKVLL